MSYQLNAEFVPFTLPEFATQTTQYISVNNFDWQLKQKMRSLKQKFGPEHIFVQFPGF